MRQAHPQQSDAPSASDGQTIARACSLIRLVAHAGPAGIRLTDLAREAGLATSTAHRVVKTLLEQGMLSHLPGSRRLSLSLDLFALAAVAANPSSLQEVSRPSLLRLTSATGDSVFLMTRSGFDAICVDRIFGRYPLWTSPSNLGVGLRHPLGHSGSGMAILSCLPHIEQQEILRANLAELIQSGARDFGSIQTGLIHGKREGFVICLPTREARAAGIAAPILNKVGTAVGALCICGQRDRFSADRIELLSPLLKQEVAGIQLQLNGLSESTNSVGIRSSEQLALGNLRQPSNH